MDDLCGQRVLWAGRRLEVPGADLPVKVVRIPTRLRFMKVYWFHSSCSILQAFNAHLPFPTRLLYFYGSGHSRGPHITAIGKAAESRWPSYSN